ncbi:mesenteric estrogen-dependent adipogenesis protein [Chanos chanos]|uniref:Mesenteric estrogen-dependent adipogenesis protein n=1 Tax=Chanos chanos TaxID=29144 RepID=A0A6J2WW82_CHACN|nr:mesenteric estrogen-dependent adipogenesis protein [Chanos chanos]
MPRNMEAPFYMDVIEVEEFLKNPPPGFTVETKITGCRLVTSTNEKSLVLMDDFESSKGKVMFQNSLGRKILTRNLTEYSSVRRQLTTRWIYVLATVSDEPPRSDTTDPNHAFRSFVIIINGSHPLVKWEMERGLDWTISSVAGESYKVNIDLSAALKDLASDRFYLLKDGKTATPVWIEANFTLKYYSDALFDFPHWFGFSKRQFKISYYDAAKSVRSTQDQEKSVEGLVVRNL